MDIQFLKEALSPGNAVTFKTRNIEKYSFKKVVIRLKLHYAKRF